MWGGELLANGKVLAQKRRRGRPPKVRPVDPVYAERVARVRGRAGAAQRLRSPHTAGRGDEGGANPPGRALSLERAAPRNEPRPAGGQSKPTVSTNEAAGSVASFA